MVTLCRIRRMVGTGSLKVLTNVGSPARQFGSTFIDWKAGTVQVPWSRQRFSD
jgi:hypothetical protein